MPDKFDMGRMPVRPLSPEDVLINLIHIGDFTQARKILNEADEDENIVRIEFTKTQMRDLEFIRKAIRHPTIDSVIRMMVDIVVPSFRNAQAANEAKLFGNTLTKDPNSN